MKLNTDRIVSLSAMVVGIGSLIVVLYQTHLMRQAQHASVLPYLMIAVHSNDEGVGVVVSNNGVGPALIQDVSVEHRGQRVAGDPYDFFTKVHPDSGRLSVDRIVPGRLIPAGASTQVLGVSGDYRSRGPFLAELLHMYQIADVPKSWYAGVGANEPDKAVVVITYESVYGERWRVRSDRMAAEHLP